MCGSASAGDSGECGAVCDGEGEEKSSKEKDN